MSIKRQQPKIMFPRYILLILLFFGIIGCDKPSPDELRARQHLPDANFVADAMTGKILFIANCSRCHGQDAKGTDQGPSFINSVYRSSHHADLTFHWAVKDGVKQHHWKFGDMPPIPSLSPEDVGHIIAHVRSVQSDAGIQ